MATSRSTPRAKPNGKAEPHRWSRQVTEHSDALDLRAGVFKQEDPKAIAQVRADLPVLQGISTRAAYPETAFLQQPDEAKPPEAKGEPSSNAPEPPSAPASSEKPH